VLSTFVPDSPPLGAPNPDNPQVFFDISVGGSVIGTIVMELKADVTPKTCTQLPLPVIYRTRFVQSLH
jgi:hypothetical protein